MDTRRDNLMRKLAAFIVFLTLAVPAFSGHENETHENINIDHSTQSGDDQKESSDAAKVKKEINETISHHLQDSHDFIIWHEMGWEFPLPVILWDEGLHVFMSSKFHHGEEVVESNGKHYKLYHGKIYKTDAQGTITYDEKHHPTNAKPLDFSITKNVAIIFLVGLLMFIMFKRMAKNYQSNPLPRKIGRFLEPVIIFVRDEIARPNIGEKHYKRYMSFLLTVFFFIWIINLAGMTPLGVNVTGNISVTMCLALFTFVITNVTAKKDYWLHIVWMPGLPVPMKILMFPIELIGLFVKPFSLMIRLYANIMAGHIVLMSLVGLIYIFGSVLAGVSFSVLTIFLSMIELLVAFLQAYIFTMLTALYFGFAVEEHGDH